jgi:hypothetical protein
MCSAVGAAGVSIDGMSSSQPLTKILSSSLSYLIYRRGAISSNPYDWLTPMGPIHGKRGGKAAVVRRWNLDGELFIITNVPLDASMNFISAVCLHRCSSSIFGRHYVG